jgi:Zn finger protein HypA/HybF involved in hydrogenase expression
MEPKIIKTQESNDRIYEYTILNNKKQDYTNMMGVRANVNCISCGQEGQFYYQQKKTLQFTFYCPACETTWCIVCKYK